MRMQKRFMKKTILIALAGAFNIYSTAAAEDLQFILDEIVVTAQREATTEISTPAYVNVLSQEKLAATGAETLIEALQFTEGLVVTSPGPYGMSHNRTASSVVIRGARKGALVLVNGTPLTLGGSCNLDRIPVSQIERVEIVKGAAATLYGSDASGGVINIITKDKVDDSVTVGYGNGGMKNASLNFQSDKLAFSGSYKQSGSVDRISSDDRSANKYYYKYVRGEKYNLAAIYRFDDSWNLRIEHGQDDIDREKIADSTQQRAQILNDRSTRDSVQLGYKKGNLKANIYGQFRDAPYSETYLAPYTGTNRSDKGHFSGLGFDAQKSWQEGIVHYLGGVTFYNEKFKQWNLLTNTLANGPYRRNQYSGYLQANFDINSKTHITLGARQQYAEMQNIQKSIFCPQFQVSRDVDTDRTLFVNVGKSFRLPTFYEGYVSAAPDLQPESGWSYELGFKQRTQRNTFTASLFALDIKDYIVSEFVGGSSISRNYPQYVNQGLELNWEHQANSNWYYSFGAVISNPRQKDPNHVWIDADNKFQITSAVGYKKGGFSANLASNWIADRAYGAANSLPVNLTLNYVTKNKERWTLTARNLLNRQDVVGYGSISGNTATYYYGGPRSIQLDYTYLF